jgi:sugar phosphate isomerase/epimerase
MLAFAREIGPNVGLLHDCFHWYTSGGTLAELTQLNNADVVSVHINDGQPGRGPETQIDQERALPGEHGVIDIKGYLHGLRAISYDGPITVEPFSARLRAMPIEQAVAETAAAIHKVMS